MDDPAWQFTEEDDITGIKMTNKDYHKINKETWNETSSALKWN